jgi:hypothetical protein
MRTLPTTGQIKAERKESMVAEGDPSSAQRTVALTTASPRSFHPRTGRG